MKILESLFKESLICFFTYPYIRECLKCPLNFQVSKREQYQSQLFLDILQRLLVSHDFHFFLPNNSKLLINYISFTLGMYRFLPWSSKTKFSGLMSLWIMFLLWTYSSPATKHAMKNPTNILINFANLCIRPLNEGRKSRGWRFVTPHHLILVNLLVCSSENLRCLQMWYLRSPPLSTSITKYKFSLSWNA